MNWKIKKLATNWRIILLVLLLALSYVAINPEFNPKGVAITNVELNSSANIAGITSPSQNLQPRQKEIITSVFGRGINDIEDYYQAMDEVYKLSSGTSVQIKTDKKTYVLELKPNIRVETTGELEEVVVNVTEEVYDSASDTYVNKTIEKVVEKNKTIEVVEGIEDIGINVKEAPESNIRKGLDLAGGTRVILKPEEKVNDDVMDTIIMSLKQRLNVYGLSDVIVTSTLDLTGDKYILVEIPGINEEEIKELVSKQGKFQAKIGNETVFTGGGDIRSVLKTAERSGIDPSQGCGKVSENEWACRYFFGIVLAPEAAERQAGVTENIDTVRIDEQGQTIKPENQYLEKQLDFYLDEKKTESLNIAADLKGKAVTEIQITGSGSGRTEQEARSNALKNMKEMQTLLATGSIPVSLDIIKTDTISPSLGKEFLNNALFVGIIAIGAIILMIFAIYRNLNIVLPIIITIVSEVFLILGFASAIKWNIDIAGIAGIIIVIGTSVDHLIIITDEALGKSNIVLTWVQKLKRAFGIIMIAGLTTFSAMIPLLFAGAGLLKGFALTTMIGVAIGVLVARPAYSAAIEVLLK